MYERPRTLNQALSALASGPWSVLAGGTDFYPMLGEGRPDGPVLDISAIEGLRGIGRDRGYLRIGALTRWGDLAGADLPPAFDALKRAAREVGSIQIQNRATIAGNLCNASPAADGVPPLLALDAQIQLVSASGSRQIGIESFIDGYRSTLRRADELVTAILVPEAATRGVSAFLKLGARKYLVISIAMVAVRLVLDEGGRIGEARVAVGACSPVARRLVRLEQALVGRLAGEGFAGRVEPEHLAPLDPIDDVRATAAYRMEATRELIVRSLELALR
jgi:CO/xanthine dehydrogenase FAD-binding subunit